MLGFPRPATFPEPPPYKDGMGAEYARTLALKGQRRSCHLVDALKKVGEEFRTEAKVTRPENAEDLLDYPDVPDEYIK